MRSIHVFDDIQREDAHELVEAMRGSDQPLEEAKKVGQVWARLHSYALARRYYEAHRTLRALERQFEESV